MAKVSPQDAARDWADGLSSKTAKIQRGIEAVTVSPTMKAAADPQKYLLGVQRAVTNGKYANNLKKVSLQDWQRAAIEKGLPRIGPGAQQATTKMADFFAQLFPFQDAAVAKVRAM